MGIRAGCTFGIVCGERFEVDGKAGEPAFLLNLGVLGAMPPAVGAEVLGEEKGEERFRHHRERAIDREAFVLVYQERFNLHGQAGKALRIAEDVFLAACTTPEGDLANPDPGLSGIASFRKREILIADQVMHSPVDPRAG